MRDALRTLEARNTRLEALRQHLAEGEAQARAGTFVKDYSIDTLLTRADEGK